MFSRRTFLRTGALTAAATGLAMSRTGTALGLSATGIVPVGTGFQQDDPRLRELAMRALDAAKGAGATYADVRLTITRSQVFPHGLPPTDMEVIGVGVRALAQGAWGFVASPAWTLEEMTRLGREAVAQAIDNAWPGVPPIELAGEPQPAVGNWSAPVRRDPFDVAIEEKLDYIRSARSYATTFRNASVSSRFSFSRQQRTFASTNGSFCTQTVYDTLGDGSFFSISTIDLTTSRRGTLRSPVITSTSAGYEVFEDVRLMDLIPELYENTRELLTSQPATPGRYEILLDGYATARLIDQTLGAPLEVDRALGLEANASGTSYLAPVDAILGAPYGHKDLTLKGNRSQPGGAATVKWDDDGVEPHEFTLVRDGVIVDYSTNREHASSLADWYKKEGRPVLSHGCAASGSAMDFSLVHSPNLEMQPSSSDTSMDDLISNIEDGYAMYGSNALMDQQYLTGRASGTLIYRIKQGKKVETVNNFALLFRSQELWKNLMAVGGGGTLKTLGATAGKGQPEQHTSHSISAPAVVIKELAVVNA